MNHLEYVTIDFEDFVGLKLLKKIKAICGRRRKRKGLVATWNGSNNSKSRKISWMSATRVSKKLGHLFVGWWCPSWPPCKQTDSPKVFKNWVKLRHQEWDPSILRPKRRSLWPFSARASEELQEALEALRQIFAEAGLEHLLKDPEALKACCLGVSKKRSGAVIYEDVRIRDSMSNLFLLNFRIESRFCRFWTLRNRLGAWDFLQLQLTSLCPPPGGGRCVRRRPSRNVARPWRKCWNVWDSKISWRPERGPVMWEETLGL